MDKLKKYVFFSLWILPCTFLIYNVPAAYADSINYSNLVDNQVFDNSATMTAAQIDSFLNGFSNSCISSNHGFRTQDPVGYNPSDGFKYGANVTAGKAIYDAAKAYDLNPQVLLTLLQREQGLVTGGSGCSKLRYVAAVGFNCPDSGTLHNYSGINLYTLNGTTVTSVTGTCVSSSTTVGFTRQIIHAAWRLKFDRERSEGRTTWAIVKTNWDNSDDLESCYYGRMTQGTLRRCPSGSAAFYDGYATIDNTSLHLDNGATAALYNYTPHLGGGTSFDTVFTTWFGSVRGTPFFRVGNTKAVYVLGSNNNYYHVPNPYILTAYGYGKKFNTEDIVQSSYINGLTYSGDLSLLAHFGGDPIYLLDTGGAHHFPSPTVLSAFGYTTGQAAVLPSWIYDKLSHPEDMQLIVTQPSAPEVYYIQNGKKSHITSQAAFNTLGSPTYASQTSVKVTNAYVASLPSGAPIMTAGTFVRGSDTGAYGIWNGTDIQALNTNEAREIGIPPDYYAPSSTLSQLPSNPVSAYKLVSDSSSSGSLYILDRGQKLSITAGQLTALGLSASNFAPMGTSFLDRLTTIPLQGLIRVNGGSTVYLIQSGTLYHIASGEDLTTLGYNFSEVVNVNSSTSTLFKNSGGAVFRDGRLVRVSGTPQVYLIDGTFTKKYIPSSQMFSEFGFNMSQVEGVSRADLSTYPTNGMLAQIIKNDNGIYWLVDSGLRHQISPTMLSSGYYNINQAATPELSDQNIANIATGANLTNIVQAAGDSKVYEILNGQKHWFTSRASFEANGGSWDSIQTLSAAFVASLPTGTTINS